MAKAKGVVMSEGGGVFALRAKVKNLERPKTHLTLLPYTLYTSSKLLIVLCFESQEHK